MTNRWPELAEHIAGRLEVTAQSKVSVFVNDETALPAAHALISAVTRRGAAVQTVYTSERAEREMLAAYDVDRLAEPAPVEKAAMEWSDVHVSFRAMLWPDADSDGGDIENLPRRLAAMRTAKGVVSTLRWQGTRWAVVRIPTAEWAGQLGVPAQTLLGEFFAGALDDWDGNRRRWQPIADALTNGHTATISSADTELSLSIDGRRGVLFAGEANLPDGEAATAPVEDRVDGHITFPGTAIFAGYAFEDLRLLFEHGRVVDVRARRGESIARALIGTDAGSNRVGELGIGLSEAVQQWTGDLFIDEKILGTVHIALGRAYPECGGVNMSSLHWDIVKDLRREAGGGGTLAIDGNVIIESGRFRWPS
ncbi:aminopeptidase [Amycolatopsis taiwanensis]|uniref:Aminopeptidase n=1 Tax=Amycolatopsis taiwanensis TaxID=342230 RepID=A0A9W6VAC5_9PSEU|nr:aminopeptidase [Amycolatopsis taiwanensis]GLY63623.1 aminopeptidase [Amycolatopsis taiwanensis]